MVIPSQKLVIKKPSETRFSGRKDLHTYSWLPVKIAKRSARSENGVANIPRHLIAVGVHLAAYSGGSTISP